MKTRIDVLRWCRSRRRSGLRVGIAGDCPVGVTLEVVLARSHELGLLGPGPIMAHIKHATVFASLMPEGAAVLDLGSGGGVPGLVVCVQRVDLAMTLLDAAARRVAFLRWAVRELGVEASCSVVNGRAELLAWREDLRERFDVVVARSFGRPAVTAECASGFVRTGGVVLVSEPADRPERWTDTALASLALVDRGIQGTDQVGIRRLEKVGPTPADVPRGVGVPARRPRF